MNTYFVGWLSTAAREQFITPPDAPSNYKDPVAIEKYKRQALDKLSAEAASMPVTGSLAKIGVYDANMKTIFEAGSVGAAEADASYAFLKWLTHPDTDISILYGFALDDLLALSAIEVMALGLPISLPYSDWHDPGFIKNPYHMLVPSECRKKIELPAFVKFFLGQEFRIQDFTHPPLQARLARDLAGKGQLPGLTLFHTASAPTP